MANDREELQRLRELDRLAELEAKAGGAPVQQAQPAPAAPAFPDTSEGRVQELLANKDPFQLPNGMRVPMPIPVPATAGGGLIPKAAEGIKGAFKAGIQEGALQGAGQSMNEDTLARRVVQTALGAGVGGVAGGISGLIGKGTQAAQDARLYSKPYEAAKWAQGQFDDATAKLQELIRGKTDVVNKGVVGKRGSTNLQEIIDEAPELKPLVDEVMGRAEPIEASFRSPLGPVKQRVGDIVEGPDLLSLKRALDDENWKVKGVGTVEAKAKDESLGRLANKMRNQINATDPEVAAANELMHTRAQPLKELLTAKTTAETPIQRLMSKTSEPTLGNVDDLVGTNLEGAAKRMHTADWLQLDPTKLATLSVGQELVRTGARGLAGAAEGVSKVAPEGSKEAILAAIMAASAPKQKRK